jgi:hypothetical protein
MMKLKNGCNCGMIIMLASVINPKSVLRFNYISPNFFRHNVLALSSYSFALTIKKRPRRIYFVRSFYLSINGLNLTVESLYYDLCILQDLFIFIK